MTRLPLIHIPFGLYSVVSKCNNNEFLFDSDDKFEYYLKHLVECKKEFDFEMYDIVCMSNHVHELYRVPEKITIADILQQVKGGFSRKFNKKFYRSGHFWKNKPYYRIIENEDYALTTMNYFHWNPVRANIVSKPEFWPFSGYRFHTIGERKGLLGKLLSPLPGTTLVWRNPNTDSTVEKILKSPRRRFIGSRAFRLHMKKTYGK